MISTRDLSLLPDVDALKRLLQSMALLDAILCPDWGGRYYSFNSKWSRGEMMGSMRDACGDDFYALFNAAGCWLKGFAHESLMTPFRREDRAVWPGMFDGVPAEFAECLTQPAFEATTATTFCIWRRYGDPAWQHGPIQFPPDHPDPDGSADLLSPLDGNPETYRTWANDYFDAVNLSLDAVRRVYAHEAPGEDLVRAINPERSLDDLEPDLHEIGYPDRAASDLA